MGCRSEASRKQVGSKWNADSRITNLNLKLFCHKQNFGLLIRGYSVVRLIGATKSFHSHIVATITLLQSPMLSCRTYELLRA